MPKGEKHRKYSDEEKLIVVEDGERNGLILAELSLKYGIAKTTIRDWRRQYRENSGRIISKPRNINKNEYTGEFRLQVVKDVKENNLSYYEAGRKYNVNKSVVNMWVKKYEQEGEEKLFERKRPIEVKRKKKEKRESKGNKETLKELEKLRAENAYLKKLYALIRKKE